MLDTILKIWFQHYVNGKEQIIKMCSNTLMSICTRLAANLIDVMLSY